PFEVSTPISWRLLAVALTLCGAAGAAELGHSGAAPEIGREVAVPHHLADGDEFRLPIEDLLRHGKLLFDANWTDQDGGGRPTTKGTGRPLGDPSRPLVGARAF